MAPGNLISHDSYTVPGFACVVLAWDSFFSVPSAKLRPLRPLGTTSGTTGPVVGSGIAEEIKNSMSTVSKVLSDAR